MKLKKIIYVTRITLPRRIAHTIQIVRSAVALANQGVEVDLFVRKNKFTNNEELSKYFGVIVPPNLKIKTLPPVLRQSRTGIAVFIALKSFFEKGRSVFYVRDFRIAEEIIKFKWLHRLPIFAESHATVSCFQKEPNGIEKKSIDWRSSKVGDYVYRNSDGLILLSKETMKFVNNNYLKTPAIFAWLGGTDPDDSFNYSFSSRNGIYYVGNISNWPIYKIEILLEAMKYVESEKLILIGGDREDISRRKHQAKDLGVLEKIEFKGYVPPGEIKNYLSSAKVAVSLLWGLKLTDYLSCGVPIVVPDLPPILEVLQDGKDCVMFQYDNSESLASAINKVLKNPDLAETLAKNAYKTAQEYSWHNRAEKIVNFIERNII